MLGLSDVIPRRIFINVEQTPKPSGRGGLSQHEIDLAFRRPQRQSNQLYTFDDHSIVLLNGKHSGNFEVGEVELVDRVFISTRLERTLVDLTVRPAYGGVSQVLEAFSRARDSASTMKLLAVLNRLHYVYPYHQAIGFYMERAGFKPEQYEKFRELGLDFDFYPAHDMREMTTAQRGASSTQRGCSVLAACKGVRHGMWTGPASPFTSNKNFPSSGLNLL